MKKIKSWYSENQKAIDQTIIFLLLSSIPLWSIICFNILRGKPAFSSWYVFSSSLISICVPVLVAGMASSLPMKKNGVYEESWSINVFLFCLAIIFLLAVEVMGDNGSAIFAVVISLLVLCLTVYSVFLQRKLKMIEDSDPADSRKAEQDSAEGEAFRD